MIIRSKTNIDVRIYLRDRSCLDLYAEQKVIQESLVDVDGM